MDGTGKGRGLGCQTVLPWGVVFCRQRGHLGPGTWSRYPCKVPSTGGSPLKSGAQPLHPGLLTPTAQQDLLPSSQTWAAADVFLYLSSNAPAPTCSGTRQMVCTRLCVVGGGRRQAPLWYAPALRAAHIIIIPCPPWPLLRWPFGQVALPGLGAPCGHSPWSLADTLEFTWAPGPGPRCPLDHCPPCPGLAPRRFPVCPWKHFSGAEMRQCEAPGGLGPLVLVPAASLTLGEGCQGLVSPPAAH